jgi:serine O-acetyltransferase
VVFQKIGANAVVLNEVEPSITVVGVPGRAVRRGDRKVGI